MGMSNRRSAACPILSISLSSQNPNVVDGKLVITLRLCYDNMANGEILPIVVHIPRSRFQHRSLMCSDYQIFNTAGCSPESQLPFHALNVNMRRERDERGRFIPLPDGAVSADNGWITMRPGDVDTHHVILDLAANRGWKDAIADGNYYWLKYGVTGGMTWKAPELANWRFGTMTVSQHSYPKGMTEPFLTGVGMGW